MDLMKIIRYDQNYVPPHRVHTGREPFRFWFQNQILNQPLRSHRKLGGSVTRKPVPVGNQEILGSFTGTNYLAQFPRCLSWYTRF